MLLYRYFDRAHRRHAIILCNFQCYPSQTKMLEGLTKDEIRISKEALLRACVSIWVRNCAIFCSPYRPHLVFILPKSSFGKHEMVQMASCPTFSTHAPCSEPKMAQFRIHSLTKELSYVSTQNQPIRYISFKSF
jgi:hypothetical protein